MTSHIVECPSVESDETATRYAAGRLVPAEAEAFEQHMIGCSRCQDAVLASSAMAAALRKPNERSLWRSWQVRFGVPLAASLLIAVWLARPGPAGLNDLARVDPVPAFLGVAVRTSGDETTRSIDAGMAAYSAGDYDTAVQELARARGSAAVDFYLGIARLKTGDYAGAAAALHTARAENSPYASEAALYRAKALLGMRRADSALSELARIQPAAAVAAHAAALADSIRTVIAR